MTAFPFRPQSVLSRRALGAGAVLSLLVLLVPGCREHGVAADRTTVEMKIGSRTFHLWVAAKDEDRHTGLMNRPSMPDDHGMIFVFRTEEPRNFYMKNTLIPLDIVYLNSTGRVVSIVRMEPEARDEAGRFVNYPSGLPMTYAIELNAGTAAAVGVKAGDVLEVPEKAKQPADLD